LLLRRAMRTATASALCLAIALGGCGSDDDDGSGAPEGTSTTAAEQPLSILVTNDDGIGAVGIDVLVNRLLELDAVEVEVVAPAENQSGSSDKTTPGGAPYADGATASEVEGTAVDGLPADTIGVALDELGLEPDVVVSGINSGQNVGPFAFASGTVGAARAAVRRGIPAIAGAAGLTEDTLEDYELAADLVVEHLEEHRDEYLAGTAATDTVVNINVPDCTAGAPKELLEVALATDVPKDVNPFKSDCTIDVVAKPPDDVIAVAAGHPALSLVPLDAPAG